MNSKKHKELPTIKINFNNDCVDNDNRIDNIFKKMNTNNYPAALIEIRKQQLKNHSCCSILCDALEQMVNLCGKRDTQENRYIMEACNENLIKHHAPFYTTALSPQNTYTVDEWEEWGFYDLYANYFSLCVEQGWIDYYKEADICFEYQILDMLNDLHMHGKILGFCLCNHIYGVCDSEGLFSVVDDRLKVLIPKEV